MKKIRKLLVALLLLCICAGNISTLNVNAATIKLNKTKISIMARECYYLRLKGSTASVKWSSSNPKIATVSAKGVVKGKISGDTVVTAKTGGKSYSCQVTVLPYLDKDAKGIAGELAKRMSSLTYNAINPESLNIEGIYKIKPADLIQREFVNPKVDYVVKYTLKNTNGEEIQCRFVYNSQSGDSEIQENYRDAESYQIEKTFSDEEVVQIMNLTKEVAAGNYNVSDNGSVYMEKNQVTLRKGSTDTMKLKNTEKKAVWKSSDSKIVSVNKDGKIKALKQGHAVVTAKLGTKLYKCKVYVEKKWSDTEWNVIRSCSLNAKICMYPESYEVVDVAVGEFVEKRYSDGSEVYSKSNKGQILVHVRCKNNNGAIKDFYELVNLEKNRVKWTSILGENDFQTVKITNKISQKDVNKMNEIIQKRMMTDIIC